MKKYLIIIALVCFGLTSINAQDGDIDAGKKLFKSNCAACHTVGKGKLTGPDLKGISDRVDFEWIKAFVKNSTAVIESGDEYANKIFKEFNNIPMPAHPHLTDGDITNIVAYINDASVEKEPEVTEGGKTGSKGGEVTLITETQDSVIDMPLIRMVFWASVFLIGAVLISLSLIVAKLMK